MIYALWLIPLAAIGLALRYGRDPHDPRAVPPTITAADRLRRYERLRGLPADDESLLRRQADGYDVIAQVLARERAPRRGNVLTLRRARRRVQSAAN